MIFLSSFPYVLVNRNAVFSLLRAIFVWHCFCCLNGCFYLGSIDEIVSNQPPKIVNADPDLEGDMILNVDENIAWVMVSDENDLEALTFRWWVSGQGFIGNAETSGSNTLLTSKVTLALEPTWDGRRLYFSVTDSYNATQQLSWNIVYEGGN